MYLCLLNIFLIFKCFLITVYFHNASLQKNITHLQEMQGEVGYVSLLEALLQEGEW